MRVVTCKLCGKKFEYEGCGHVLYCGEKCKEEAYKISYAKVLARRREETKQRRLKDENAQAILNIAIKAAKLGMSYGQYVTRYL